MILRYTVQKSHGEYSENCDEEFYETEVIEYEPSAKEIENALINIIYDMYFDNKKFTAEQYLSIRRSIKSLIRDTEIDPEIYEEEMLDFFEKTAKSE